MNSSNGIVTNVCSQTAHEHAWVDTDQFGLILGCNDQAATFLGYGSLSAVSRSLLLMFLSDKPCSRHFARALIGRALVQEGIIRPQAERARAVRYCIERAPSASDDRPVLRWRFEWL
jgi:PAS domain-containing protein